MLIQKILVVIMVLALLITWRRARQNVIRVAEAIVWSVLWIAAALVILLPNVTTRLAQVVGVGRGVDLVMYSSVAILFLLVFKLFIQHEKLERKLTEAVRIQALQYVDREIRQAPQEKSAPIDSPTELINFMIKERERMQNQDDANKQPKI